MKYLTFIFGILFWIAFAYDIEYDRDIGTWVWLLESLICISISISLGIVDLINKNKKIPNKNSLVDAIKYMLSADPECVKDDDIVSFYYRALYEDYIEFGKEITNLKEKEIREKLNKRLSY